MAIFARTFQYISVMLESGQAVCPEGTAGHVPSSVRVRNAANPPIQKPTVLE